MKRPRFLLPVLLSLGLASAAVFQSGCLVVAAGAAGAGAVAYVRGDLSTTLASPYENVEAATNRALADLQLIKINESKDAFVAVITARTADDKKIEIKLTKLSAQTKVQIRVGVFGDEQRSIAILDKIKANL